MQIYIDEGDQKTPIPAPAPARRLTLVQKFVILDTPVIAIGALVLYAIYGAPMACCGIATGLATMLVLLTLHARKRKT